MSSFFLQDALQPDVHAPRLVLAATLITHAVGIQPLTHYRMCVRPQDCSSKGCFVTFVDGCKSNMYHRQQLYSQPTNQPQQNECTLYLYIYICNVILCGAQHRTHTRTKIIYWFIKTCQNNVNEICVEWNSIQLGCFSRLVSDCRMCVYDVRDCRLVGVSIGAY